jgi:hypothetical protein
MLIKNKKSDRENIKDICNLLRLKLKYSFLKENDDVICINNQFVSQIGSLISVPLTVGKSYKIKRKMVVLDTEVSMAGSKLVDYQGYLLLVENDIGKDDMLSLNYFNVKLK